MLDVEVVGSIAPGARVVVYFAPNTDAGFLDAITTAIHDTSTIRRSVHQLGWSRVHLDISGDDRHGRCVPGRGDLGVTVCVASGDNGSSDGVTDGADHVDFPASSPFALACGGPPTRHSGLHLGRDRVGRWREGGASGGGVSGFFPCPPGSAASARSGSRANGPLAMRGVPDVGGDADPTTGYAVRVDGTDTVIGGTSAVAPLWAALIARINASTGKAAGYINPQLYRIRRTCATSPGANGDFGPGGLGCVHRPRQPQRRGCCGLSDYAVIRIAGAEQAEEAGDDQIDRDDVVEQPRHDQDQYTGDERDERCDAEAQCLNSWTSSCGLRWYRIQVSFMAFCKVLYTPQERKATAPPHRSSPVLS